MSESRDYQRIERAIRFLDAHARRRPSLDETAAHVGLSPHHFQRLFQRWAGTSPKRFLQYLTAERAKERPRDARTVLDATLSDLEEEWPRAELVHDPDATAGWIERIFDRSGSLPVLLRGTNLQLRVWEALLRIPEGTVVSYGSLAGALGKPTAARAVAGAVAANPIAYLIPCHRVLRATGAIGGYRWGTARKRAMLGRELGRDAASFAPRIG